MYNVPLPLDTERPPSSLPRYGSASKTDRAPPNSLLTDATSVVVNADELDLLMAGDQFSRDCFIVIMTEIWLYPLIPDTAAKLTVTHTKYRATKPIYAI